MYLMKNIFFLIFIILFTKKKQVNCSISKKTAVDFFKKVQQNQGDEDEQKLLNSFLDENSIFFHTDRELELVNKFSIGKNNFCSNNHGFGIDLFVMVISSPVNFEARDAIRQTWGEYAIESGSKILFVIGQSSISRINEKIIKEDEKYDDILQVQYLDDYYNLTLKSLSIINWMNDNCEKAKYLMKVDDDMFVNMPLLIDFVEKNEYKNAIVGKLCTNASPIRNLESKWYVSNYAYPKEIYPNYAAGPGYLIHREAIPKLLKVIKSNFSQVIKLEDVFLTGIIAKQAGVKKVNNKLFNNIHLRINKCNFNLFISSHQHKPKEILKLWNDVHSIKKVYCLPKLV